AGLIARLTVRLKGGAVVSKVTDASWKSLRDPRANWHNRPLDTSTWPAAAGVGNYRDAPWGTPRSARLLLPPPPLPRPPVTPPRAPCPAPGLPRREAGPPRHALRRGSRDRRPLPERPPRHRRPLPLRLDRLHEAGLLPDVRRLVRRPPGRERARGDPGGRLVL